MLPLQRTLSPLVTPAIVAAAGATTYPATVLADSPIIDWRVGELAGTNASDSSGNGNDGTYTSPVTLGAPGLITGDSDTAVTFTGGWVAPAAGNIAALQLSTGTAEAWIKTASPGSGFRGICVKAFAYSIYVQDGELGFYDWGGGTGWNGTGINVDDNVKHHVAVTFQSGVTNGTKIHLDGSSVLTASMTVLNQTQAFNVGSSGSGSFNQEFQGVIDEAAVYGSVLSSARILAHYNAGV